MGRPRRPAEWDRLSDPRRGATWAAGAGLSVTRRSAAPAETLRGAASRMAAPTPSPARVTPDRLRSPRDCPLQRAGRTLSVLSRRQRATGAAPGRRGHSACRRHTLYLAGQRPADGVTVGDAGYVQLSPLPSLVTSGDQRDRARGRAELSVELADLWTAGPVSVDSLWATDAPDSPAHLDLSPDLATLRAMTSTEPAVELPDLLTAAEVCQLLRISKSSVQVWRQDGLLRAHPLPNGHYRYPREQPAILDALRAAGRPL